MPDIMDEKRRERRIEDFNKVTVSVVSEEKNLSGENIFHNYTEDISASGARIYANSFLPVNTLVKMDIRLENVHQLITTMGKVKWFKTIFEDEWYEGGVEFVNPSGDLTQKLSAHMMSLLHSNSEDFDYSYIT